MYCHLATKSWQRTDTDNVISEVAAAAADVARRKKVPTKGSVFINFLKEGVSTTSTQKLAGLLSVANVWDLQVDLRKQLKFPSPG